MRDEVEAVVEREFVEWLSEVGTGMGDVVRRELLMYGGETL